MSGPMAASYGIEAAVLISAQSIATGAAEIAASLAEADRQAEATRTQRRHERQQMRAARQAGIEKRRHEAADRSTRHCGEFGNCEPGTNPWRRDGDCHRSHRYQCALSFPVCLNASLPRASRHTQEQATGISIYQNRWALDPQTMAFTTWREQ